VSVKLECCCVMKKYIEIDLVKVEHLSISRRLGGHDDNIFERTESYILEELLCYCKIAARRGK